MTPLELRRALEQILHEECNVSASYELEHGHPVTPLERDSIEMRIERLFTTWREREERERRA